MARIVSVPLDVVDCTSDPHYFEFESKKDLAWAIERVCESKLVMSIRSISLDVGHTQDKDGSGWKCSYQSDHLFTAELTSLENIKSRKQETPESRVNKTYGLVHNGRLSEVTRDNDIEHKIVIIPMGLQGVKRALDVIGKLKNREFFLSIGVVWTFAGDSSCSDYIEWEGDRDVVNFGNQDWWIDIVGYKEHLELLEEIAGGYCPDLYDRVGTADSEDE